MHKKQEKNLEMGYRSWYLHFYNCTIFWQQKRMLGVTEAPQKAEVIPESIRKVKMQAQAGMEAKLMLSYFTDLVDLDKNLQ